MDARHAVQQDAPSRRRQMQIKSSLWKLRRHPVLRRIYKTGAKLLGVLYPKKNLIMFESFFGRQYSCNPRAIYEYLLEHHPHYEMCWSVDKRFVDVFEERGIPYAVRFTLKWFVLMFRARYWVSNSRLPLGIFPKPNHTIYLQTWHGTPLKRLVADMEEVHMPYTNTKRYKRNFFRESRNWDFLVSPNAYSTKIFRRAFRYDRTIIESGYPRNDYLYTHNNEKTITALKEKYGIPKDKKVILYAPTWRDDQAYFIGKYKFDLDVDLRKLQKALADDYVILLRMHYLVMEQFDLAPFAGFAYDFSNKGDIRDFYLISDLLVTDYSSAFFDYANLKRPIIFYVYDMETYRDKLRGFYFDLEKEAPGPLVRTTEALIDAVRDAEARHFQVPEKFEEFYRRFCYLEKGESTRRVVEAVFLQK